MVRLGVVGFGLVFIKKGKQKMAKTAEIVQLKEPTNGGADDVRQSEPYTAFVTIQGSADLLFHAWNPEAVDEKGRAAKNSAAKKSDNVESYVNRNDAGEICIPGEYLRGSIINAAKFRQDPRSPRKSAMDLYKAAVVSTTILASLGVTKWDYLDRRRVTVQRAGINRTRPAMKAGWKAEFSLLVTLPEYVSRDDLRSVIEQAGRLIGVGDFRPTFGRFGIIKFE
jgi:hypothetical protein